MKKVLIAISALVLSFICAVFFSDREVE